MTLTTETHPTSDPEALAERLFHAGLGAIELLCVHLGHQLGLYRALAGADALSPAQLARATGIAERYAREWLEQQAICHIVDVAVDSPDSSARSYRLPPAYAGVLVDPDSLAYAVPFGEILVCVAKPIERVIEAFRTGGGVHHSHYDPEHRHAQGAFNRPAFLNLLAQDWLPHGLPDVHQLLATTPGARVADVGCGHGWACIGLARAYPDIHVHGYDVDAASIAEARRHAVDAGVGDRVTFAVHDATDDTLAGRYDLVFMVEVLHDVARPVELLRSVRRLLAPGGTALIVDERVADEFAAPGDEVERFMYSCSVLHCLPIAMVETPSAATGTVIRPKVVRRYATAAGFDRVDVVPIEHDFFRFYRLDVRS